MRVWAYQLGLSLTVLVAWPLLGGGNQARAAFLIQTNGSLESGLGTSATEFGLGNDWSVDASRESVPETQKRLGYPLNGDGLWWSGLAHTTTGCGGTSASPNVSGSVLFAVAVSSSMNFSSGQVVRWLYLEDVRDWPPPFAWRLFRPPRMV
jgi:hypothetical protein